MPLCFRFAKFGEKLRNVLSLIFFIGTHFLPNRLRAREEISRQLASINFYGVSFGSKPHMVGVGIISICESYKIGLNIRKLSLRFIENRGAARLSHQ